MSAPSSRLVRKERSKIVKQTLLFAGLAVALILAFIFVILPLFISTLNRVINTNPLPQEQKVELQIPLLNAPASATNSAQLSLTGFAQPKTEVVLLLNGQQSSTTKAGDDGAFVLPVGLTEGENSLAVFSRDEHKNESPNSQEFIVKYDQQAPKIVVDEPQPDTHFDRKTRVITLRGVSEPGAKVYINDRLALAGAEGAFSTTLSLQDGKNELKIVAIDQAGNKTEQPLVVYLDT